MNFTEISRCRIQNSETNTSYSGPGKMSQFINIKELRSPQNYATRLWVILILDQCLQKTIIGTVTIYGNINMLLQFYTDIFLSENYFNNLV